MDSDGTESSGNADETIDPDRTYIFSDPDDGASEFMTSKDLNDLNNNQGGEAQITLNGVTFTPM